LRHLHRGLGGHRDAQDLTIGSDKSGRATGTQKLKSTVEIRRYHYYALFLRLKTGHLAHFFQNFFRARAGTCTRRGWGGYPLDNRTRVRHRQKYHRDCVQFCAHHRTLPSAMECRNTAQELKSLVQQDICETSRIRYYSVQAVDFSCGRSLKGGAYRDPIVIADSARNGSTV